jgi:hypothetical protein
LRRKNSGGEGRRQGCLTRACAAGLSALGKPKNRHEAILLPWLPEKRRRGVASSKRLERQNALF